MSSVEMRVSVAAAERAVDEDFESDRGSELVFGLPGHDHSFLVKERLHANFKFAQLVDNTNFAW